MLHALILTLLETVSFINSFSFPVIFPRFQTVLLVCISVEKDENSLSPLLPHFFVIVKNISNICLGIIFYKIVIIILIAQSIIHRVIVQRVYELCHANVLQTILLRTFSARAILLP